MAGATAKDIAKKYEKLAPNTFRYIYKENGGHGSTINKGMELATGKYFKVVDGDDWVDTDSLVTFINYLKQQDSDLVLTNHVEIYPNYSKKINLVDGMQPNKSYTWDDNIDIKRVVLHTLTVKTSLLRKNNVHITEKCFYVDVEFVVWAAYVSHTITYFDLYLYMYRLGESNQSVAKTNMLKNIKMQEKVSYSLVKMYDQFVKAKKMEPNQDETIFNTFKRSIGSTMRTYLLMPTRTAKSKVRSFDNNIKNKSLISYKKLNDDEIKSIIDLLLKNVEQRLVEQGLNIKIDKSVKELIAKKGVDKEFGERPLRRAIQNIVEDKLAEEILDGNIKTGVEAKLVAKDDKVDLKVKAVK